MNPDDYRDILQYVVKAQGNNTSFYSAKLPSPQEIKGGCVGLTASQHWE